MGDTDLTYGCMAREIQHVIDTGTAEALGRAIAQGLLEEMRGTISITGHCESCKEGTAEGNDDG